ncbi:ATP-binding protein [Metabacillus sp. GX 13764]|uniref:response regulator n=1 Tax=Metabacillus kandeliae TaxID=2900151 RepID=UPI001E3D023F|nr:response regulator [Metabacillus kandeliae]MCD7035832.1 ATP-binding protein [Metabacillus kandeliae]
MRLGIRSKILIGYGIIILCLIISIVMIGSQISNMQKQRNYIINHDINVFNRTNSIEKQLMEMQTGQRGFLASGNPDYLESYEQAKNSWEKEYGNLQKLIADPGQKEKLAQIHTAILQWIQLKGEPLIQLKRENNAAEVERLYKEEPDRNDIKQIRADFDSFRNKELAGTKARAAALDKQNSTLGKMLAAIVLGTIAFSIIVGLFISNSIITTVRKVIDHIKAMATGGDLTQRLHVKTKDEIKELGDATNYLLDVMEQKSIVQMQINEVNLRNQGISSMEPLAQTFIHTVAEMTDSAFAAFYLKEGASPVFSKTAAYADNMDSAGRSSFELGKGMIGQAAEDQEPVMLNDLNHGQRLIGTGLSNIQPKSMFIVPVSHKGETVAVIELASLNAYSESHRELLISLSDMMGLTINSVLDQMEIKKLLAESQAMTEELQTQSEELQTQSEELQMQSEELRMINEQLEGRSKDAEEKSKELEQAKEELEAQAKQLIASSKYKSEFLANMSHELRTPLNSILILSEMLAENMGGKLAEDEKEFAQIIHSSGQDLLHLIDEILDLSKVESGKLDVFLSEVNLAEFPSYVERNFSHVAEQKGLYLKIEKAAEVPDVIHTDEKRLNQIVKNLLSNAFKFTETGGVTVKLDTVKDQHSKESIRISVKDTGIGIPKEKHELIFDAFQQGDGATMRKFGGTGLGLSICRELAKLLGGEIRLISDEGIGSEFIVIIPFAPDLTIKEQEPALALSSAGAEAAAAMEMPAEPSVAVLEPPAGHSPENALSSKNVLIVDDDNRNIFVLEAALKSEGMNVMTASNGLQCLEVLESNKKVDIILMDIMMPVMDGYEAIRKIRNEYCMQQVPIIALTAKAMKNDREKCIEAGASDYISKPLKMEQLLSVMRVWLAQ